MTEYEVHLPEDRFSIVEFRQDDLPGIGVINSALVDFEPKVVFSWHLSIMVQFENLADNGMPAVEDRSLIEEWEDTISTALIGDVEHPNALLLGRITWNETREILYRVYDPEPINEFLQSLIEKEDYPRPFDFRIDPDQDWELAQWHLQAVRARDS